MLTVVESFSLAYKVFTFWWILLLPIFDFLLEMMSETYVYHFLEYCRVVKVYFVFAFFKVKPEGTNIYDSLIVRRKTTAHIYWKRLIIWLEAAQHYFTILRTRGMSPEEGPCL